MEQTLCEKLVELFGEEYILRQCAEECVEQAQAILKMIRSENDEATTVTPREAYEHLVEEIADVTLTTAMVMEIMAIDSEEVGAWIRKKIIRTQERIDARITASAGADIEA